MTVTVMCKRACCGRVFGCNSNPGAWGSLCRCKYQSIELTNDPHLALNLITRGATSPFPHTPQMQCV